MPVNQRKREDVEQLLLAFLVSKKGSTPVSQLERIYEEQEGEPIPYKEFGFATLLDYLKNIKHVLMVTKINNVFHCKGIDSDKTRHISSLVERQKTAQGKISRGRKNYGPSRYYPKTVPPRIYISPNIICEVIDLVDQNINGVALDVILQIIRDKMPRIDITSSDVKEQLREVSHKVYVENDIVYSLMKHRENSESTTKVYESSKNNIVFGGEEDDECTLVSYDHKFNKKKTEAPVRRFCSTLNENYTDSENNALDDESDDNFIDYKGSSESENQDQCFKNDNENEPIIDAGLLINERTKIRLEKLIEQHPNGIWCAELPDKYLELYKIPLNYSELGFNSVREYAMQLPEIFYCTQPHHLGDFKLYYTKKYNPPNNNNNNSSNTTKLSLAQLHQIYADEDVIAVPPIVSTDTCIKLIPDNVMTIGESVGQLNVSFLMENEYQYVEVYVVEIFHPSFFWVQLRKKRQKFERFMEELDKFYSNEHKRYAIPAVVLDKGLNCACKYNNIWHRGIIKSVSPDLKITVMFYDYGTLCTYDANSFYYLHRSFSSLPAQAIPCGLINVKPVSGDHWPRHVTYQFAEKTSKHPLIAIISSVDEENNSMLVTLTDTLHDEDLHINDWLVQNNLAVHGKMVRIIPRNFTFRYYKECLENLKKNTAVINEQSNGVSECIPDTQQETYSRNTATNTVAHENVNSQIDSIKSDKMLVRVDNSCNQESISNKSKSVKELIMSMQTVKMKLKSNSDSCSSVKSYNRPKDLSSAVGEGICLHLVETNEKDRLKDRTEYSENHFLFSASKGSTKLIDWSTINKSEEISIQDKKKANSDEWSNDQSNKKNEEVETINNYFLNVIRNNPNFNSCNWKEESNVNKSTNNKNLSLNQIQYNDRSFDAKNVKIVFPKKMIDFLKNNKESSVLEGANDNEAKDDKNETNDEHCSNLIDIDAKDSADNVEEKITRFSDSTEEATAKDRILNLFLENVINEQTRNKDDTDDSINLIEFSDEEPQVGNLIDLSDEETHDNANDDGALINIENHFTKYGDDREFVRTSDFSRDNLIRLTEPLDTADSLLCLDRGANRSEKKTEENIRRLESTSFLRDTEWIDYNYNGKHSYLTNDGKSSNQYLVETTRPIGNEKAKFDDLINLDVSSSVNDVSINANSSTSNVSETSGKNGESETRSIIQDQLDAKENVVEVYRGASKDIENDFLNFSDYDSDNKCDAVGVDDKDYFSDDSDKWDACCSKLEDIQKIIYTANMLYKRNDEDSKIVELKDDDDDDDDDESDEILKIPDK